MNYCSNQDWSEFHTIAVKIFLTWPTLNKCFSQTDTQKKGHVEAGAPTKKWVLLKKKSISPLSELVAQRCGLHRILIWKVSKTFWIDLLLFLRHQTLANFLIVCSIKTWESREVSKHPKFVLMTKFRLPNHGLNQTEFFRDLNLSIPRLP